MRLLAESLHPSYSAASHFTLCRVARSRKIVEAVLSLRVLSFVSLCRPRTIAMAEAVATAAAVVAPKEDDIFLKNMR